MANNGWIEQLSQDKIHIIVNSIKIITGARYYIKTFVSNDLEKLEMSFIKPIPTCVQFKFMHINNCNIYAPNDWEILLIQRNKLKIIYHDIFSAPPIILINNSNTLYK